MSTNPVVTATVEVAVDPATAFAIFTEEIGQWWKPGPINWNDSDRAVGIRIEPGVGGRWIEVHDAATGEGLECGRILVWEPGVRLVFLYRDAGHEIDARVRVYRLRPEPFVTLQAWLDQVQAFWTGQLDAFKAHVEHKEGAKDT